jgi:nucleotide-binding universal stress UspA family protein
MEQISPKQFKNILVAVDESPQGANALAYAISESLEDRAEKLFIISVFEEDEMNALDALDLDVTKKKQAEIDDNLAKYKQMALDAGVKNVETLFAEGQKAGEVIVNHAIPAVNADLIVIGAHSREGFFAQMGSQATYVARRSPISVMIVRDGK